MTESVSEAEPNAALSGAVAVCILLVGLSSVELFMRLVQQGLFGDIRVVAIKNIGWALLPVCAYAVRYTQPLGWKSVPVTVAGLGLLNATILMSRGLWIWSGTFDAYWLPKSSWQLPCLLGWILGYCCFFLPRKFAAQGIVSTSIWLAALTISALVEWVGSAIYKDTIDSLFAPTRAIVLGSIVMVLAVGVVLDWRSSEQAWV